MADRDAACTEDGVKSMADRDAACTEDGVRNMADRDAACTEDGVKSMADNDAIYMDLEFDEEVVKARVLGLFKVPGKSGVYIALEQEEKEETYLYEYVERNDGFELKDIDDNAYKRVEMAFQAKMEERAAADETGE